MSDAIIDAPLSRTQPMLFSELPETEVEGRRARRARAVAGERGSAPAMAPPSLPSSPFLAPRPDPEPFNPAALSNAELRALLEALPDSKLAFLLTEAARDAKRRILPKEIDPEADTPPEPNPILLRAAAAAAAELSGEDDCAAASVVSYASRRGGASERGGAAKRNGRSGRTAEIID